MSNLHKTSRGAIIDMDRLKLANEHVIAVGNSGMNARGDIVKGNKIIKSREEIMQESYNISGNNVAKDAKIRTSARDVIQPDPIAPEPKNLMSPYEQRLSENNEVRTVNPSATTGSPRGGLANAVQKSADINAVLEAQRKRI